MLGTFHGLQPGRRETTAEDTDWRKTLSMGYFLFIAPKVRYLKYKSARWKPSKASLSPQSLIQAHQHGRLAGHSPCCYSSPLSHLFTLHFAVQIHGIACSFPNAWLCFRLSCGPYSLPVLPSLASALPVNTSGSNAGASSPNVVGKKGRERMVTSQVLSESLGWAAKWGSLASCRKGFKSEPQ